MTKPVPNARVLMENGIEHPMAGNNIELWLAQFPNDKLIKYEWPAYTFPGCYPLFYLTRDNGVLCPVCANDNIDLTLGDDPQWEIVDSDANWEDPGLYCDNCNARIESAYAEDEVESEGGVE